MFNIIAEVKYYLYIYIKYFIISNIYPICALENRRFGKFHKQTKLRGLILRYAIFASTLLLFKKKIDKLILSAIYYCFILTIT